MFVAWMARAWRRSIYCFINRSQCVRKGSTFVSRWIWSMLVMQSNWRAERFLTRERRSVKGWCGEDVIDCKSTTINWWMSVDWPQDAYPLLSSLKIQYVGSCRRSPGANLLPLFIIRRLTMPALISPIPDDVAFAAILDYCEVELEMRHWAVTDAEKWTNVLHITEHLCRLQWWACPKSVTLYYAIENIKVEYV